MKNRTIELLAPAKNYEIGIEAIMHGADAVYIGASKYGARSAAGNSISDIAKLVDFAHKYFARVYVTLNTILHDDEIEDARLLVNQLYNAGVDALIIQDMGLLRIDLPPIALHASTQCNNRTVEQVKFLENAGFSQAVLARELSLSQIKQISDSTSIPLEVFVYGALCVSYSGCCYMSEYVKRRSANRGECAQLCRLPYSLTDKDGNVIARNKHILSLRDFNAEKHLQALIDAGVSSFKIEGRLKEMAYVKNVTAYFRNVLDSILEGTARTKSSSGGCNFFFSPQLNKTFTRGATDYFLSTPNKMSTFDTPKSIGEYLGKINWLTKKSFTISPAAKINNGDGVCVINSAGELCGMRINNIKDGVLYPFKMPKISLGDLVYRNIDQSFMALLANESAQRYVDINVSVEYSDAFNINIVDEDGIKSEISFDSVPDSADCPEKMLNAWKRAFGALGDSIYRLNTLSVPNEYFVPISKLTEWRRKAIENHTVVRQKSFAISLRKKAISPLLYYKKSVDYTANILNQHAYNFYANCGVERIERAYEATHDSSSVLMHTKYCIRRELGMCAKGSAEPLYLMLENHKFKVEFCCSECEMKITAVE